MPASSSSPSVPFGAVTESGLPSKRLDAAESISLLQALAAVPDRRGARGRRHSLQSVLLLALGAVLAGACSYAAITDWAAVAGHRVALAGRPPWASTIRRVLTAVDAAAVEAALTGWVLSRRAAVAQQAALGARPRAEARCVLAADGKTLRGARRSAGRSTQLISAYDPAHRLLLAQAAVIEGTELAAFPRLLATLPALADVLISADALHCQREHAVWLHDRGGHYLFTVKGNQKSLRRAVAALPWGQVPGSRRRQRGHGRIESRSVKVIDLDGHRLQALFPHARRAIKVVRSRRRQASGARSVEVVYAVTSLDHRQADPALLAGWIQDHWLIENAVHHVRDVTQREDASSVRAGSGPQVMAALRNTALNLHRLAGHTNIARAQRQAGWRATTTLEILTTA